MFDYYFDLFEEWLGDVVIEEDDFLEKDFIYFFIKEKVEFDQCLFFFCEEIKFNGMIWVFWLKKVFKVFIDIIEDVICVVVFENKLVDVKVCVVDKIWLGLKLMICKKDC